MNTCSSSYSSSSYRTATAAEQHQPPINHDNQQDLPEVLNITTRNSSAALARIHSLEPEEDPQASSSSPAAAGAAQG